MASIVLALALSALLVPAANAATIAVTTTADELDPMVSQSGFCSLREAVKAIDQGSNYFTDCVATGAAYGTNDEIVLGPSPYGLTRSGDDSTDVGGDLDIDKPVTITGAGANLTSIDANDLDRAIEVSSQPGAMNVTLRNLTVTDGTTPASNGDGGGIRNDDEGTLTLQGVEVTGNTAAHYGGAVYSAGPLSISGSVFEGNHASFLAGAILPQGGTTQIANSTFVGNSADDSGGAMYVFVGQGPVTFTNVTMSGNTTGNFQSGAVQGENSFPAPVITFIQTILANAPKRNCDEFRTYLGTRSLEDGDTCGLSSSAPDNNLLNTNPMLASLTLSPGASTRTMALPAGSPAVDAVPITDCATAADQRGVARPQGYGCDTGAFELVPTPAPTGTTPRPAFDLTGAIRRCKKKFRKGPKRKNCIKKARAKALG